MIDEKHRNRTGADVGKCLHRSRFCAMIEKIVTARRRLNGPLPGFKEMSQEEPWNQLLKWSI